MGLGSAPALVGLDIAECVSDLAAELREGWASFQPAPALESSRADAPAIRKFSLVQINRLFFCHLRAPCSIPKARDIANFMARILPCSQPKLHSQARKMS